MEVDKVIYNYYKSEVDKIKTPSPIILGEMCKVSHDKIYNLLFAAAITLASVVLVTGMNKQSTLAYRSTEFYAYHNLDTIIPAGLVEINKFVSETLISGGK